MVSFQWISNEGSSGFVKRKNTKILLCMHCLTLSRAPASTGYFRTSYWLLCWWFVTLSLLLSTDCSTWVSFVPAAALLAFGLYAAVVSVVPTCMRPGGVLSRLRYGTLGSATHFGAVDTALFGRYISNSLGSVSVAMHGLNIFCSFVLDFGYICLPYVRTHVYFTFHSDFYLSTSTSHVKVTLAFFLFILQLE
jgi:hypothetical protein